MTDPTADERIFIEETRETAERLAAKIIALPKEGRLAYFDSVRRNYEAAFVENGIGGAISSQWLNVLMVAVEGLVQELDEVQVGQKQ